MKKYLFLFLGTLAFSANAELIRSDWKVESDKKVVLDTETGIEWLRLNESSQYSDSNVLLEMESGGKFDGWRFASLDEVRELASKMNLPSGSSGSTFYSSSSASGYSDVKSWLNMMGTTGSYVQPSGSYSISYTESLGKVYNDGGNTIDYSGVIDRLNGYNYTYSAYSYSEYSGDPSYSGRAGYFLVSDGGLTISSINDPTINANNPNSSVPLASSLSLLLLGLAGLRKRKY